jgi:hypothetical protein
MLASLGLQSACLSGVLEPNRCLLLTSDQLVILSISRCEMATGEQSAQRSQARLDVSLLKEIAKKDLVDALNGVSVPTNARQT